MVLFCLCVILSHLLAALITGLGLPKGITSPTEVNPAQIMVVLLNEATVHWNPGVMFETPMEHCACKATQNLPGCLLLHPNKRDRNPIMA